MSKKNFQQVYEATEALCKSATDGGKDHDTTLYDWMLSGDWETMTPAQMASEWDSMSEDC